MLGAATRDRRGSTEWLNLVCELAPGVRLVTNGNGCFIIRERPLHIFSVKPAVIPLVDACASGRTLGETLSSVPQLAEKTVIAILDRLTDAGLVTLRNRRPDDQLPRVSVVIPVRNRPEAILRCLSSLDRLRYPRDRIEIIVVDDGSTDHTSAVIAGLSSAMPLQLLSVPVRSGQAFCRNLGSQEARGEILAFIDSDCEADPDWLRDLAPEFADERVAAVGGAVLPLADRHWLQRYEEVRSPLHQGSHPAIVRPRTAVSYVAACNLLVRRQSFLEVGGFVIDRGEEVDLIWRLCKRGLNVHYRPVGRVMHDHRYRMTEFVTRRAFYAGSEPILLRRHPENRRPLNLPISLVIAIAAGVLVLIARQPLLAPLISVPIAVELAAAWRWSQKRHLPIRLRVLSRAIASRQLSALYYAGSNAARYYAIPLVLLSLAAAILWAPARWLAVFVGLSLFLTAAADWYRLRPRLGPTLFIVAHILDTMAYHLGLLTACVRQRTFRPLQMDIGLVT